MQDNDVHKPHREVFRSRFSVVLCLVMAIPLAIIIRAIIQSQRIELLIMLFLYVIFLLLMTGVKYVIEDDKLIFKTWFLQNQKINIRSIERVQRTYCPLSSNAGSLKRLYAKMKKGSKTPLFIISPHNEEKFLERLKQINPDIIINVENKTGFYRLWNWDI